ncbi:acyl-CoA dehydrogenase family protein [Conexivisphaera calida]|nr:acyl-CoA dehydrogenase family protein [Conexivisphaera calida]
MASFPFDGLDDFEVKFTEDQEMFRRIVEKFAEDSLRPRVKDVESADKIPVELIEGAKALGLMGIGVPPEYGGQGGGFKELAIMSEEISRVLPAFGTMLLVNRLFIDPLMMFGTADQKSRYLPPVAKGEVFAAHANTEPGAGSDVAGISTTAKMSSSGSKWILNGRKIFISNADRAQFFLVSARTSPSEPGKRWRGITAFIVERDYPGLRIGQKFNVMGLMGEHPSEVLLEDVEVPESNVLGKIGEGFKVVLTTYDYSRILIAAQAVGIAQGAFEAAFNYSIERNAFERPIIAFEGVSFKVAEMLMELEAARLLTYWAANLAESGDPKFVLASSIAKYYATETAVKISKNAISIHGGVGVDKESLVERYLRDAMITTIYEGANDVQKLTIAKSLLRAISKDVPIS